MHPEVRRVAVAAGTPYDTRLGCSLLRAKGFVCDGFPLAASPREQGALQYFGPDVLKKSSLTSPFMLPKMATRACCSSVMPWPQGSPTT